jgi:hypothetical protein
MGIDQKAFIELIKDFEASMGPGPRTLEYRDEVKRWRKSTFDKIEKFDEDVVKRALDTLSDGGEKWLPPAGAILDACREAVEPVTKNRRAKIYKPAHHECGERAKPSLALNELQWISIYEADHILCPGDIQATCPACGAEHLEYGLFQDIINRHPEETKLWNPRFKGLMLCESCSKKPVR